MGSDLARRGVGPAAGPAVSPAGPPATVPPLEQPASAPRPAPARPTLGGKEQAPVLVTLPPPFGMRLAQLSWILSFALGGCAVVYLLVIRSAQLPDIAALVRAVDDTRAAGTYDSAADIVFWSVFVGVIAVLLVQLGLVVALSDRRPRVRWWMLGTLFVQGVVLLVARELVAVGERGRPLELMLLGGLGLALLGMFFAVLPPVLRWSARKHDVRRGPVT